MQKRPQMSDPQPPRMAPLARLPIFLSLAGKRALVAGGSAAAAWKVELLSAAGAEVDVYAPASSEELLAIAAQPPVGRVTIMPRDWEAADFSGAALVVGAFDEDHSAARFADTAHALKIPFNVIDKPAFCSFAFGAIVNRSPLVVGISTDGAAPVFAQTIRSRIEALLPAGFARWAEAARIWRDTVKRSGLSFGGRRRFWQIFATHAVNHPDLAPDDADLDRLLAEAASVAATPERGSVALVGTGPGDPELLTLRAARALRSADVILFDDAVSPDILDFARREAKKMLVRTSGDERSDQRQEIAARAVMFARGGKRVVRLMMGDPANSRDAQREIAACHAAGIMVEMIPGVPTAAKGAPLHTQGPKSTKATGARVRQSRTLGSHRSGPSASS
jgi:uroporphyrin-III C-methyltransferase / precorrin-2 dehydrogenase / sirohydrochlorin ferrochelatase